MKNVNMKSRAGISIAIALLALGLIVLANRATAPEVVVESAPTPQDAAPPEASTASGTPTKGTVTVRNFTLQLGQPATVDGYKFALRNVEDSRCPDGVQCIRAGEVKAYLQVEYGTSKKEVVATSNGEWVSVGGRQVHVTKVIPSHPTQIAGSYIVFLEARRSN